MLLILFFSIHQKIKKQNECSTNSHFVNSLPVSLLSPDDPTYSEKAVDPYSRSERLEMLFRFLLSLAASRISSIKFPVIIGKLI